MIKCVLLKFFSFFKRESSDMTEDTTIKVQIQHHFSASSVILICVEVKPNKQSLKFVCHIKVMDDY